MLAQHFSHNYNHICWRMLPEVVGVIKSLVRRLPLLVTLSGNQQSITTFVKQLGPLSHMKLKAPDHCILRFLIGKKKLRPSKFTSH
jgi:hypothetical protein